jgi:hypothetical protein
VSDDIQDIWHAGVEAPTPSKPKVHQPTPIEPRHVARTPVAPRGIPVLNPKVGDRVTVTRAGRDRTAIVRVVGPDYLSIDFDPPLPHPAPVGSYLSIRVKPGDITRIVPPPDPVKRKLIQR